MASLQLQPAIRPGDPPRQRPLLVTRPGCCCCDRCRDLWSKQQYTSGSRTVSVVTDAGFKLGRASATEHMLYWCNSVHSQYQMDKSMCGAPPSLILVTETMP